jgi:hypothetical protein
MSCECSHLPDVVKLDSYPSIGRFDELETGDWNRLVRCPHCGHLWSVDEWDRYYTQFAFKIPKREGWRELDAALRRQYLIQSRGGLADEKCIWKGCEQRRVRGVVYCADHLYKTGVRE